MSYTKEYLESVVEHISKHSSKVGDTIEVQVDTCHGNKIIKHIVTENDIYWERMFNRDGSTDWAENVLEDMGYNPLLIDDTNL